MRCGGVRHFATDDDGKCIRRSLRRAAAETDLARFQFRRSVEAENGQWSRVFKRALLDHQGSATLFVIGRAFFGRLEEEFHRAVNLFAQGAQHLRDTEGDRCVGVMAAGVHDAGCLGFVGHVVCLGDGQGVHVGPIGDHRAGFGAFQQGDHSVPGDAGSDFVTAKRTETFGNNAAGAFLTVGEFRVLVEIAPGLDELCAESFGALGNPLYRCLRARVALHCSQHKAREYHGELALPPGCHARI